MHRNEFVAEDHAATSRFGLKLAKLISGPVTIALNGTLGAGKTFLAKGIIAALGVDRNSISSPTFTICHEFTGVDWSIYHVDLYRVSDEDELHELGIEQWIYGDGITIIEWADRFSIVNDNCDMNIEITITGDTQRKFTLYVPDDTRFENVHELLNAGN
ncbi:MAG TPA: tRNA (adenosine(37)-N6)-threonylcarbamoyltransferase complex ATPase subunit type 1 TsaE [Pirellulaceae bacterium]|nr:tRNA (adenosine(37)-N6)-threonylcarbamoyltransferase complex ATPase subunit type 1 TsaE [Pirellulaceae bacterium]HMO92374.1 tRNA (adenosine(37)-N6)-threonylcarbamoyltransferase complex ATPase subunit type 1 TsaE [Pirellulaceae bacterium]HMP70763.1 tRNA (adenosine(37)-N6)-threonylcarbamoyltransferase complex ATPase subunit type 1 TsaE [Pirellulaceae bacterium]